MCVCTYLIVCAHSARYVSFLLRYCKVYAQPIFELCCCFGLLLHRRGTVWALRPLNMSQSSK
jgi:hypothetical protein